MKKRVAVVTSDLILYNKIRLLLRHCAEVDVINDENIGEEYQIVLLDLRSGVEPSRECVRIGRGGDIPLPFRHEELLSVFESRDTECGIELLSDGRSARVIGEVIKLTELEYKLLGVLLAHDGFVSKEELLDTVWSGECDQGIVNVYVYYLRRKLEKSGNKVIISSRNEGYKIDEKYRRKG